MLKDFRVTDSWGLEGFRVKGIWRLHDLGVKLSSACYELRMLQRSCAMNYGCWCAFLRSEKTHTLARNEFQVLMCHHAVIKDTHAGLQRILRHAMNYGCGRAIGCNEWRLLIRHRAVRKDTHAGLLQILQRAMNDGCGSAIGCNELRLLIRHRAVRKDTHAGRPATNAKWCWLAIARSEKTHTHADMQRIPAGHVTSYRQRSANDQMSVPLSIYRSMSLPIYFSMRLGI